MMLRRLAMFGGTFVVAALLFVAFVVPSETGRDPFGTGRLLGLTGLYMPEGRVFGPVVASASGSWPVRDGRAFPLAPFESVELKYDLAAGDGMVFCWTATGEVLFDLHAEPDGGSIEDARSYAAGRDVRQGGTYVAPFDGIHGWFWENRGTESVTVRLVASGMMAGATRFHDNDAARVDFQEPAERTAGACQ